MKYKKLLNKSKDELAQELFGMSLRDLDRLARGTVTRVKDETDKIVNTLGMIEKEGTRHSERLEELNTRISRYERNIKEELA